MGFEARLTRLKEAITPRTPLNRDAVERELEEKGFLTLKAGTRVLVKVWTETSASYDINHRLTHDHEVARESGTRFEPDSPERRAAKKVCDDSAPVADITMGVSQLTPPEDWQPFDGQTMENLASSTGAYIALQALNAELTTDFLIREPEIGRRFDALKIRGISLYPKLTNRILRQDKIT